MVVERSGNLTYPKKLMIYLGFPTEPEKTEARRTNFSRYFRQLDNPEYNRMNQAAFLHARYEMRCAPTRWAYLNTVLLIALPNRSAGVLACEFGRRLAARIQPKDVASQRDAAGTRSRDGCATRKMSRCAPGIGRNFH